MALSPDWASRLSTLLLWDTWNQRTQIISFLFLRSYDTLYRWHLLVIGQTKIIHCNLPDTTGKIEKKLIFVVYVAIMIIPAFYKWYPKSLLFLATLIFIFIEFDILARSQKWYVIICVLKMGFPCSTISYIRIGIYGNNWVNSLTFSWKFAYFTNFDHLWFENNYDDLSFSLCLFIKSIV